MNARPRPKRSAPAATRPFVFVNMAMTADGKIATANRVVSSFSSARDQTHLYELRATADAVMAGARTLDLNAIKLGPGAARFRRRRLKKGLAAFNLRVIVTGSGSIKSEAKIFQHRFSPILILTTKRVSRSRLQQLRALADDVWVSPGRSLDFVGALHWLRQQWKVRRLLCEGGGELNGALFRAGLVDELHLTVCPKIFGGRNAPTIADGEDPAKLLTAAKLDLVRQRRAGDELFLVYRSRHGRRMAS